MAWTTPATWTDGVAVTAAQLNAQIRDNLRYLKGLDGVPYIEAAVELPEMATPSTPASGRGRIYFKSDGFAYALNDAGVESVLSAPVYRCRAYNTGSTNVPSGTSHTTIAFNAESYDTANMHNTAVNNSRIVMPAAGIYAIHGQVRWQAAAGGRRQARLLVNGSTAIAITEPPGTADGSITPFMEVFTLYLASANDYVELQVLQTSGSTITTDATSGGVTPALTVVRVSA